MADENNTAAVEESDLEPVEEESDDDLDELLNMDLNQLSNTSVVIAETNPVVEGVSKKAETLAESPGIVDVITAKDIQQFGAKNLYEVLERATSVYMTGSHTFRRNYASIRGNLTASADTHVLILINGRPFRDSTLGGLNSTFYTCFPIHLIDHVEVIRGPGSVLYGTNAATGVINVVTKSPEAQTRHASALGGTYNWQSYNLAAGNSTKEQHYYVGATYSRAKGWPFTATGVDLTTTNSTPWGEENLGVFGNYEIGNFSLNVFAARANSEILGDISWPSEQFRDYRVFCDVGYFHEIGDYQSLELHFTYNFKEDEISYASAPFVGLSHGFLLEATHRAQLTDNVDWIFGGLSDFHLGRAKVGAFEPVSEFTEIWYGVYMQFEYQACDWLKLVGGMQANMPGEIKSGIVPRAAAIVSLHQNLTCKFLYGQAFRSPYQVETSIFIPGTLVGNPELAPETTQTFDVQLAYHLPDFRLAGTYFHTDLFGIISRTGTPQTYFNGSRVVYQGFELENEWKLSEHLRWQGSVTYQENERDGESDFTPVPNWMAKLGLAYETQNGLSVGVFDSYFSDPIVPDTAAVVNPDPEPVHLLSINTTLDVDKYFESHSGYDARIQFLIQNLLDEPIDHVEFDDQVINSLPAGAGRTYYGGVTIEY